MDPILAGFIGYLLVVVAVGFITFRYTKTLADYLLAGRRLGAWVVAFSERASGESAWLLIGLPGLALASGFSAIWSAIGCAAGIFTSWTLVARRLRVQTEELGALTLPDYFEARYKDASHLLRIASMAIIVFFFTFYVSAQFLAAGKVLHTTFGLEPIHGMLIGAVIIIFYTIMGGFFAVAWTDLIQGILMVGAMTLLPLAAWIELGGISGVAQKVGEIDPNLLLVTGGQAGRPLIMGLIIGSLGIGLGYVGQPHLLTRFMAIRNPNDLRKGTAIAMSWVIVAFWGAVLVGIAGLAAFGVEGLSDPEHVMPQVATLFLPAWIAGIVISAAIAAMMSTADSQLLVATSALAEDVYHQLVDRKASQGLLVMLSRLGTIFIGVMAFVLALQAEETVFWFVLYAWAGLGAAFGPGIVLSLWWKRTTKWGVFAGMAVGAVTTVVWHNVPALKELVYELVPAFVLAMAAVVVVSLLTQKPGERPRAARTERVGLLKPFFVVTTACAVGLSVVLTIADLVALFWFDSTAFGGYALIPALLATIVFAVLVYRVWELIQDGRARTKPGRAIGFLFIPLFNIYWIFQAVWGLAKDYNTYVRERSLDAPELPEGLFLGYSVLVLASGIPLIGLFLFPVVSVLLVSMVSRMCDAVNAVEGATPGADVRPS